MNINKISYQAFNGVHTVKVSKDVFKGIDDCSLEFNDIACDAIENAYKFNFKDRMALKFLPKKSTKIYDVLESPGYDAVCQVLPKYKPAHVNASWLYLNTKTPITLPENEEYHKFYVLTGEEKNQALSAFSWLNTKKLQHAATKGYEKTNDTMSNILRELAKLSQILDEKFFSIIKGKPVTEWRANSKEELEKVIIDICKLND